MRILHINKYLYRRGGVEGYMEDLAELQRAAGHNVALWGMDHPENTHLELQRTFAPYVELGDPPCGTIARAKAVANMIWSRVARRALRGAIAAFRPDVAHLHGIYHQLTPSILGPLAAAGVPTVMTVHDYKLVCPTYLFYAHGTTCEACIPHKYWHAPIRRCRDGSVLASGAMALESAVHSAMQSYRHVSAFICPSNFLANKMKQGRVFPDRLHVLRHFADVEAIQPKPRPGGDIVIAGRLSQEKGVDIAIRAMSALPPEYKLQVMGDGPERSQLEALASETAPGRVTFFGRLAKKELHARLREGRVALVPSRCYENQPLAVLEAFANGVPVVASDIGGISELVRPGVDGELVPPDDPFALAAAISHIASDPTLAYSMGEQARQRIATEFSPALHVSHLTALYANRRPTRSAAPAHDRQ